MKFSLVLLFLFGHLSATTAHAGDYIEGNLLFQMPNSPYQRGTVYTAKIYMTAVKHVYGENSTPLYCGLGGTPEELFEGDEVYRRPTSETPWCMNYMGKEKLLPMPPTWLPTHISTAQDRVCVLDMMGVRCWHYETSFFGPQIQMDLVPELDQPRSVSVGSGFACALVKNGVRCWGSNSHGQLDMPELKNPTQVSAGVFHVCALDDDGMKCWGDNSNGQLNVPPLINPNFALAGYGLSCARDDSGFKCWGRYENIKKEPLQWDGRCDYNGSAGSESNACIDNFVRLSPSHPSGYGWADFNLDEVADFAQLLSRVSTPARARYFSLLMPFLQEQLSSRQRLRALSEARFLAVKLMSVAITNGDSEHYKKTILPAYQRSMSGIEAELGIAGMERVPLLPLSRMAALQVIRASLLTLSEMMIGEDQLRLQNLQRVLGQVLADPQNLGALLAELDANDPLWEKASNVPRIAFLAQTVRSAASWLKNSH